LQETTICHAEENEYINLITEDLYDHNRVALNYNFSLSPFKELNFAVYDDQKISLTGLIENPGFEDLMKRAFLRIVLMKLAEAMDNRPGFNLEDIYKSPLSQKEVTQAQAFMDNNWL